MGKPSASPIPGIAGNSSDSDAVSLHTQPGDRVYDDDISELQSDSLPPLYADIEADNAPLLPTIHNPSYVLNTLNDGAGVRIVDVNSGAECFINPRLDRDPELLERQIQLSASKPPRPSVRILGRHSQTVKENGKSEKKILTDFDVSVDLTPYLFSDATRNVSWTKLRTVENTEKTWRGTILRKRAPGVKRDLEVSDPKPTLAEWCHRYCASHARVKSFTLHRRVVGFDEEKLKQKLEALVRGTNYRGTVDITFPVRDAYVLVYNDCKINRWRVTPWIVWMCYLTFLWLITWPLLFFQTKRFEVAVAEWPFSVQEADGSKRYVSMSEDHIYNLWGRAISRAVLDKRQGTLDQEDLIASQMAPAEPFANALQGAPRFLREGVNAITAINRQLGWGRHDHCA
ncbi:hypothetical protein N657DRAFT_647425 [Parathielavia appendiculata]|uniref:Uncharacterized protein n=1 Tax=Parathielavia appendiculata TaxID=2587402 RepID=A0AAN6TWH8_9PEZI|nr:hypothetical protein N657DRAFT_647425 [Parathielavia appendiculata]